MKTGMHNGNSKRSDAQKRNGFNSGKSAPAFLSNAGPSSMNGLHFLPPSTTNGNVLRVDGAGSSFIQDDEVKVNLAMADLMAYLQVVANNSTNLPLTRRDDPEVTKTVSTLTADEYARKSSAFIPADVRVVGGSFTKYGRVWDLPTSEEYNASDGAQEPGRSYGGACCNAMLKVLYDAANEAADAAHDSAAANALFDDDEESTLGSVSKFSEAGRTFHSLVLDDVATPATISWATLMRKMKAEIEEIEYAQAPTITSTRRFDLNKPFSLIPEDFDPKKGKKRSLLIGCNYHKTAGAELKASHDDIRSMKDYIVNVHGFPEAKGLMTVLMDDDNHKHPTHLNITESLKTLSEQSRPGDAVFIQFSGHGGRILDAAIDNDAESYDEVIVPTDFNQSGLIRDTLIFKTLLAPMRYGVTVTILIDCCDTGMMMDLPYAWSTRNDRVDTLAKMSLNDDFSFVRFLKVVKTLYESSTFTQLGKTVRSALQHHDEESEEEKQMHDLHTVESETDNETIPQSKAAGGSTTAQDVNSSILNALTACTSPQDKQLLRDLNKSAGLQSLGGLSGKSSSGNPSFFEQLINCTVGQTGDESDVELSVADDDTYGSRAHNGNASYDDATTTTFDSMTDDGYQSHLSRPSPPRRSGRGRPRGSRR